MDIVMSANIKQIKKMFERIGKTNLLQKQKADLNKERLQLEATYFQQKQPKVELEKEINECWQNWLSPSNQKEVE